MKGEIIENLNFEEYENHLISNQSSTFFHSINHLKYLSNILNSKPKFIVVKEDQKIKGVLPFFSKKDKIGEIVNSLPFFGSYGGLIASENNVREVIIDELNEYNKMNEVISCTIISNPFDNNYSIYDKKFKFQTKENRMIQCTDISNHTEESLFSSFEKRTRWSVRKAEKNNINIISVDKDNDLIKKFYEMHEKSMNIKNGRPKPKSVFKNVLKNFTPKKDYEIIAAIKNDKPLAFVLVFYYKEFAEYYMPAYDAEFLNLQSPSILIWSTMKNALKRNVKFYNFGGTWKNQDSLYLFKRSWGAKDFNYNYYIFRDIDRIVEAGIENLVKKFEYYYICPYDEVKKK
jgi:lipid II:glycine glycyltransferase (peptidoglycan interpeptide bridge formation enzyme)